MTGRRRAACALGLLVLVLPRTARGQAADDRAALVDEFRTRGLIAPDAGDWSADDAKRLELIRRDEPAALDYLRRAVGDDHVLAARGLLRGRPPRARLTKAGHDKYIRLLAQEVVHFFEKKGIEAKNVFGLQDSSGQAVFDDNGQLTEAGRTLYRRASGSESVTWRDARGVVYGADGKPIPEPPKPPPNPWRRLYELVDSRGPGVWMISPKYLNPKIAASRDGKIFAHELNGFMGQVDFPAPIDEQPVAGEDCFVSMVIQLNANRRIEKINWRLAAQKDIVDDLKSNRLNFADHGCTGRLESIRWEDMEPKIAAAALNMTQGELDALADPLADYYREAHILREPRRPPARANTLP
jgi:hypothetical protein